MPLFVEAVECQEATLWRKAKGEERSRPRGRGAHSALHLFVLFLVAGMAWLGLTGFLAAGQKLLQQIVGGVKAEDTIPPARETRFEGALFVTWELDHLSRGICGYEVRYRDMVPHPLSEDTVNFLLGLRAAFFAGPLVSAMTILTPTSSVGAFAGGAADSFGGGAHLWVVGAVVLPSRLAYLVAIARHDESLIFQRKNQVHSLGRVAYLKFN
mmetsp:Transcript_64905/g.140853  ORF Transcript_64905/g.140853 Transcript_64905/m.140853 type:complete len:212 (+) Transcript_64905:1159-1794(+)